MPATTPIISSDVQPAARGFALTASAAEPGCQGRLEARATHPSLRAEQNCFGGQWARPSNWAQCCWLGAQCWHAPTQRLGASPDRSAGVRLRWEAAAERRGSSKQPQGHAAAGVQHHGCCADSSGRSAGRAPAAGFSGRPIYNRAPSVTVQRLAAGGHRKADRLSDARFHSRVEHHRLRRCRVSAAGSFVFKTVLRQG